MRWGRECGGERKEREIEKGRKRGRLKWEKETGRERLREKVYLLNTILGSENVKMDSSWFLETYQDRDIAPETTKLLAFYGFVDTMRII